MTMTFSFHESFEFVERSNQIEAGKFAESKEESIHLFAEKLRIPEFRKNISRPRLTDLLAKSSNQFGATLICGRAGTGKTAVAADFAAQYENVAWYSVEAADTDWNIFSNYLFAAIFRNRSVFIRNNSVPEEAQSKEIQRFFGTLSSKIAKAFGREPLLIVLDDIHHVFDTQWFDLFFASLVDPLLPNVHILLLCRSKPSYPLWRMRSKQLLNVIDEKLLALNREETVELYKTYNLTKENAEKAHRESFGRISKLKLLIDSASNKTNSRKLF
jgi:ATP/maltotriose-dependent transcriptional regulator MalT